MHQACNKADCLYFHRHNPYSGFCGNDFGHFWLKAGRNFPTVWAEDGKLRSAGGSRTHYYGPQLVGLRPLKQWWFVLTEPRTQTPGQKGPSEWVEVGAEGRDFGLKRQDKGGAAMQTHQYTSVHLPRGLTRPGVKQTVCKLPGKLVNILHLLREMS